VVLRSTLAALAAAALVYLLLFFGLTDTGLLGPDEPRYAAIGRAMALSGDWITPRLWGEPWFEKPALLYWMAALGFRAGLGPELAPRLPVALMSLAFLVFFERFLEREFGRRAAWYATAFLATSAGWVAFSHVAVTDLPLAATSAAAMLISLEWIRSGSRKAAAVAGGLLGLALLAKGLVPVALAAPFVWIGRRERGALAWFSAAALLVAAPWYAACAAVNGRPFLEEFFWKHHFERYSSEAIQHVQPFWFYVPVLAAGLAPWTPLAAHLVHRRFWRDPRRRHLLAWFGFGFVFFSAATNKLPGYLLPLLPPACALLGVAAAEARSLKWTLSCCAALLVLLPFAGGVLPRALEAGLTRAPWPAVAPWALAPAAIVTGLAWWWERAGRRDRAVAAVAIALVAGIAHLKMTVFPALDQTVSARTLWRRIEAHRSEVCLEPIHRTWRYGLNYYSVTPLPDCSDRDLPLHVLQRPGEPPRLAERPAS
jgi:4-amino-4-deoxy-L-arabinose transferase-like glycosyltransferase